MDDETKRALGIDQQNIFRVILGMLLHALADAVRGSRSNGLGRFQLFDSL